MRMRSLVLQARPLFGASSLPPAALLLTALLLTALLGAACVEDVDPPVTAPAPGSAGSAGTGMQVVASAGATASGTGGSMSSAGAGGASSYADDATFGMGAACPLPMQAAITDFTFASAADAGTGAAANTANASFGDFTSTFSGSTYVYPTMGSYTVQSDVSESNWHLSGTLGDYSGFGITFNNCYRLDASAFQGISFTIRGSVPMGNTVTFSVGTAENEISHVWLNRNTTPAVPVMTNAGRCVPLMSQYDGSCGSPTFSVPVTAEPTTINVTWAQLGGGRPAATVDPKEITFIAWNFPPPGGAGTSTPSTYDVDLVIDDLRFIPAP